MGSYLKTVYDEKSKPYTEYPGRLCNYLITLFNLKRGMKLLEVGCGRGEFLREFQKTGLDVYGADISRDAVFYNRNIPISICDAGNDRLPFPSSFFDVVYSKSFIEHLGAPDNFFKEAYRVLKPGGLFLTLVPDWEVNYKIYFDDYTHKTPYTRLSLEDAYKIFDFASVRVIKFRQLPFAWKHPSFNIICSIIAPFAPVRTKNKFLRWSRELMLLGSGRKPQDKIISAHEKIDNMKIQMIVFDFDGVMTDNKVIVSEKGEESVVVSRADGLGVGMLRKKEVRMLILSTEKSPVVKVRGEKLKIETIHGVQDKKAVLKQYCKKEKINLDNVVYVGNDLNDYEVMKAVGVKVAPSDAHAKILEIADIVTASRGGQGVVRDLADIICQKNPEQGE